MHITFKQALAQEKPLQIAGTLNALCALIAKRCGFKALYLSGAGVANASYALPDLGLTCLENVLEETRRITSACELPLLVDIDTGFGGPLMIERTIQQLILAGASAAHIEDQLFHKRCGHREGKELISKEEMCDRITACIRGRKGRPFTVIARTDALSVEGLQGVIERAVAYKEAGADALFLEAAETLSTYEKVHRATNLPLLANMTEFGKTPLFSARELHEAGVSMVLYPLTAMRAMNKAAERVYRTLRSEGSQKELIEQLQSRSELYDLLDYEQFETRLQPAK